MYVDRQETFKEKRNGLLINSSVVIGHYSLKKAMGILVIVATMVKFCKLNRKTCLMTFDGYVMLLRIRL